MEDKNKGHCSAQLWCALRERRQEVQRALKDSRSHHSRFLMFFIKEVLLIGLILTNDSAHIFGEA